MALLLRGSFLLLIACGAGCSAWADRPPGSDSGALPVYNDKTGRLEQITSDRDGDGKIDTRAFMDGKRLQRIEIDRNNDGRTDRWEHYIDAPPGVTNAGTAGGMQIARAEEANGSDERVTRTEFYEAGLLLRVEEDADVNGRVDKWEHYDKGAMVRVDLDLKGGGFPDRRVLYRRDGSVDMEVDPDGRGNWRPFTGTGQ
jgi:hypothetical protein